MAEGGAAGFPVRPGLAGENAVRPLDIEGFPGRVPWAGRTRPGAPAGLCRRWRLGRGGAGAPAPHQWAAVGRRCGAGSWPRVRPPARLEDLLALAGRRRSAAAGGLERLREPEAGGDRLAGAAPLFAVRPGNLSSEVRRVGKEGVSTWSSWGSP